MRPNPARDYVRRPTALVLCLPNFKQPHRHLHRPNYRGGPIKLLLIVTVFEGAPRIIVPGAPRFLNPALGGMM